MDLGKIKSVGNWFKQPDVMGQAIAQVPKLGISLATTELGNKIISSAVGAVGNILNERFNNTKHKDMMRSLFTNMMFTFVDPTANQMREMTRNWSDLVGGLKMKNFSSAFGALVEEPQEVVSAIKHAIPQFKGFKGFKAPSFKKLNIPMSSDNIIQAVDTSTVSTYKRGFGKMLSDDDFVDY